MMATNLHRRGFIKLGVGALVWTAVPGTYAADANPTVISAATDSQGRHYLCGWQRGELRFKHRIKERAHDCCHHAQRQEVLFFSRRPGQELHVLDMHSGELRYQLQSPKGSHFYGHGCLNADGSRLFVTENDVAGGGTGRIAVYDCHHDYQRLGSFASGGIGPHQLAMMPDGRSLVIANGGILTLPENGRNKLNLDTMQPRLSYLDSDSGRLLDSWAPPHHQLSLRHLAVAGDATVIVGAQFQGNGAEQWPLVFSHRPGQAGLQNLTASTADWRRQNNYIASVAVDIEGRWLLTTSPRGGVASLWDLKHQQLLRHVAIRDVAGAAYHPGRQHFVLSNGLGQLLSLDPEQDKPVIMDYRSGTQWDNHLLVMET